MAEKVEQDGKKFWKFPDLPYDVGQKTRSIYNFYMRTNPETGQFFAEQWAVYPNNSTAASLGPLLKMLQSVTDANSSKLVETYGSLNATADLERLFRDNERWQERLSFYEAKRQELAQIDPDQPVGTQNPVSKELATFIVNPLFLGWYPNDTAPFSEQPGVFSQSPQEQQAVMDLYVPFSLANQIVIRGAALDDAYAQFKLDLQENAKKFFEENAPNLMGALSILPWVVVGAIGLGLYSRSKS